MRRQQAKSQDNTRRRTTAVEKIPRDVVQCQNALTRIQKTVVQIGKIGEADLGILRTADELYRRKPTVENAKDLLNCWLGIQKGRLQVCNSLLQDLNTVSVFLENLPPTPNVKAIERATRDIEVADNIKSVLNDTTVYLTTEINSLEKVIARNSEHQIRSKVKELFDAPAISRHQIH